MKRIYTSEAAGKKGEKIKEIQEKTQYSQMIVSYAAKMLIEKIK